MRKIKKYILMTTSKSKYEDFIRYHFRVFNSYLELQRHLLKFPHLQSNDFVVFEETNIKVDKSLYPFKRIIRR